MKIAELFDVKGHSALVTGAGSGIGFACADVLAANGARVCLVDRDQVRLDQAAARLADRPGEVMTATADVTDLDAMNAVVGSVVGRFGRLDIAFINAGIGGGPGFMSMAGARQAEGEIENLDEHFWHYHINGNLNSVFLSLKSVVPPMKAQKSGSIIITTSLAALKPENFVCTPYMAAKAGVAHLMHQVALELATYNVRVNAMAPGSFLTGIGGGRMARPEVQKRFAATNPMGRMADPEEIMGLALFLASPASSYVTGAHYSIDGGGTLGLAD